MKKKIFLLILLAACSGAQAQLMITPRVIASSGGFDLNGNLAISYTIGEMTAIETTTNGNLIFTQGFQQPSSDSLGSVGIADISGPGWQLLAYPNPTSGLLFLEISGTVPSRLQVKIFDVTSRLVKETSINPTPVVKGITTIDAGHFAPGLYLIRVESENKTFSKTIRIQKI